MTKNQNSAEQKLRRLADAMAKDVEAMSDEEILAEAKETYGDVDRMVAETRQLIENGIAAAGRTHLENARKAIKQRSRETQSNVVRLPLDKKRTILKHLAAKDPALSEGFTLAARIEADSSADIDGLLEDLVELGLIDGDGNIL